MVAEKPLTKANYSDNTVHGRGARIVNSSGGAAIDQINVLL
jgi:hypothetical protein